MRSFNNIIFVLSFLTIVAACGNGDGNGPAPCDCQGKADCTCPNPDGGKDGTDGQIPLTCGNQTCDTGETCTNCFADCPCQEGEECHEGKCEVKPYECPSDIPPPEQREACMPAEAKDTGCAYDEYGVARCYRGFHEGDPCSSDAECQAVPADKWPPCVCWQFCGYAGEWDCEGDPLNLSISKSTDGTYCEIKGNTYYHFIGLPNDPPPRYPLDNPVHYIELTTEGLNFKGDGSHIFQCTRTD